MPAYLEDAEIAPQDAYEEFQRRMAVKKAGQFRDTATMIVWACVAIDRVKPHDAEKADEIRRSMQKLREDGPTINERKVYAGTIDGERRYISVNEYISELDARAGSEQETTKQFMLDAATLIFAAANQMEDV